MIHTKSCWEPTLTTDGLRILATRYWVRGLPKSAADLWMPNLGPSEKLLKSYKGGRISWREFSAAYRREILGQDTPEPKNPRSRNAGQKYTLRLLQELSKKQTLTFMCHCEKEEHCHRSLLRKLLRGNSSVSPLSMERGL